MLLRKIVCLHFALLLVAGNVYADENTANGGTIRGQIFDFDSEPDSPKIPIKNVVVKITSSNGTQYIVKTSANGNYKCTNLPAGTYTIKTHKIGYMDQERYSIDLVDEKEQVIQFAMLNLLIRDIEREIIPRLKHFTEYIAKRYELNETVLDTLQQSIQEAIDTARKHERILSAFLVEWDERNVEVLDGLLSHPDIKAALSKHLTEEQLKDYTDFINADTRRNREKQAIAHHLTATLDQAFHFTPDQRQKVVSLLLSSKQEKSWPKLTTIGRSLLGMSSQSALSIVHNNLKISLGEVLTHEQKKLWQLVNEKNRILSFKARKGKIQIELNNGWIDAKYADIQLKTLMRELGVKHRYDDSVSDELIKRIIETKFLLQTSQISSLDEHSLQMLNLAAKGVVEKYFEVKKIMTTYRETETEIITAARSEKITSHQAYEELQNLSEKLWHDNNPESLEIKTIEDTGVFGFRFFAHFVKLALMRRSLLKGRERFNPEVEMVSLLNYPTDDITHHALYQLTLKDVLSEDVYAQYNARQTEKENYRQQALRNLVVAFIDMRLILDDTLREELEMNMIKSTVPSLKESMLEEAPMSMLEELFKCFDTRKLTPWQWGQYSMLDFELYEI